MPLSVLSDENPPQSRLDENDRKACAAVRFAASMNDGASWTVEQSRKRESGGFLRQFVVASQCLVALPSSNGVSPAGPTRLPGSQRFPHAVREGHTDPQALT